MIPVVTPDEMAEIDRQAPEPTEVLIERAGAHVARHAVRLLGGTYGRRVVVVAGKGNNGADGRVAAARLRSRRVQVEVLDAGGNHGRLPECDLVIDAAYGTGFRGEYKAPDPGAAKVLAVDIPSGVDGLTGEAGEGAVRADRTLTLAALKPGLLLHPGAERAGAVELADIGLDAAAAATAFAVEHTDVVDWLPDRAAESHKWKSAVYVVGGSQGMTGAAHLCAQATLRAGAGTVRLAIPGVEPHPPALEVVGRAIPAEGWADEVITDSDRARAMVVGPGLGRSDSAGGDARALVGRTPAPVVVDADALFALGDVSAAAKVIAARSTATVLTPHEGEYNRMTGEKVPPADRLSAVRHLAAATGAVVLLKGSTTVVADPDGQAYFVTSGDSRLATAGTGDVLAGVVGAFLAMGLDGLRAAAAGAYVHGAAARLGWRRGLVASDLLDLIPAVLNDDPPANRSPFRRYTAPERDSVSGFGGGREGDR